MYSPKLKDDFIRKLYEYKQSLEKKKPMTKLVAEAVEEYINRKTEKIKQAL